MKINNLKYMALSGITLFLAAFAATSCDDANDWTTDSSYDRLFKVNKLSISANATDAEVTWTTTPNTEYYIIEISKDSLYDEIAMGTTTGSIVYGENKSITKSPFTLNELDSSTKYYLRVKSMSNNKSESKWSYPDAFSFKTKSENILNPVNTDDRGEDYITLSWTPMAAVTHIKYAEAVGKDENNNTLFGEMRTFELTDEQKNEGIATIKELKASTSYLFTIYNRDNARGTRVVSTKIQIPDADLIVRIDASATLTQEMINSWSDKRSVTIRFEDGAEYDIIGKDMITGEDAGLTIPSNMSITFFGAEGDSKAVLNMKREFILGGIHGYIRFENLIINDSGAQYLFNQGNDASSSEISFTDCELTNFARSIIRFKDMKSISVDQLSFESCIISNQGSGSYALITLDAKEYTVGNIQFTNTTFNTLQHTGIALYNSSRGCAKVSTTSFNNCTFYNCIGAARYILDDGATGQGPAVTFNNTILGKTFPAILTDGVWTSKSKGIRTSSVTLNNTYQTTDGLYDSNQLKGYLEYSGTSGDLFKDPANGDFTIKDGSFPANIGDPRWYAE